MNRVKTVKQAYIDLISAFDVDNIREFYNIKVFFVSDYVFVESKKSFKTYQLWKDANAVFKSMVVERSDNKLRIELGDEHLIYSFRYDFNKNKCLLRMEWTPEKELFVISLTKHEHIAVILKFLRNMLLRFGALIDSVRREISQNDELKIVYKVSFAGRQITPMTSWRWLMLDLEEPLKFFYSIITDKISLWFNVKLETENLVKNDTFSVILVSDFLPSSLEKQLLNTLDDLLKLVLVKYIYDETGVILNTDKNQI